jgi:serine/threonine protein kinase
MAPASTTFTTIGRVVYREREASMTPERLSRLRELFEAALRQPAGQRSAWLLEACQGDHQLYAETEKLLRADALAEEGFTLEPRVDSPEPRVESRRIGQYEVLRELGRGGMGVVYLAKRADNVFSKPVAIKVLRAGTLDTEMRRRFDQEREIVARLDHPNIARLLDGGTTDHGLPYSVIEYVDGQPIDVYCDERRLDVSVRVTLLQTVCSAVQYAHQHLVVHRDLKPSNILVTPAGTVKLLDFGIAKVLHPESDETRVRETAGFRPLTLAYASPEQVKGLPVSTGSDVYSLGVILYELLTHQRPHAMAGTLPHQLIQAICDDEPPPPSLAVHLAPGGSKDIPEGNPARLRRRLSGELDTIVMMALRKEPARRYNSVEKFSEDLGRHLSGLPVLAEADSALYRARKFVGRHRVGVAASVLVLLSMAAAVVGTSWQARVAQQERQRAEQQAVQARVQSERAERAAALEADQRRIADERTREAEARRLEAALALEKAGRFARSVQTVTAALLELNASLPDVPGGAELGRRAADTAERSLLALRAEGFADASVNRDAAAAREAVKRYEELKANITTTTPPGWLFNSTDPDEYEHGLDRTYSARGAAAYIKSRAAEANGIALLAQLIEPAPFAGKRVRVTAMLRSSGVRSGGLMFEVGSESGFGAGNAGNLPLSGSNEWGRHAVVFDVPGDAVSLAIGFALAGPGTVWADNFSIDVVDASTPLTRTLPSAPVDPGFDSRK